DPNRNPEPERTPQAESSDWRRPGLVDQHGEAVEVERPEASRGTSLDVTEFGADPAADSGDDAAAIRDAIAAADPGDEVVLPPGTYDLQSIHPNDDSANLLLRSGVHLRGAGASKTVLVTSFDGDDNSRVIRGAGVTDVIVADLTITSRHDGPLADDPNDADAGGGPMYGIHLGPRDGRPSSHMLVERVRVERFERHGISAKA